MAKSSRSDTYFHMKTAVVCHLRPVLDEVLNEAPIAVIQGARQAEVDCIVELADGSVIAIEVKSSSSLKDDSWRNMDILRRKLGERFLAGVVLYSGRQAQAVGDRMYVLPLRALWARA